MSVSQALAPLSNILKNLVEPLIPLTENAIAHAVPFLENADRVAKGGSYPNLPLWYLVCIMSLTGLIKITLPSMMAGEFPKVPSFAWPLLGLWQLLGVFVMYVEHDFTLTAQLNFIFIGGVVASMALKSIKDLVMVPFPMTVVIATYCVCGPDSAKLILPYMSIGAAAAVVLTLASKTKKSTSAAAAGK
jgi:hypothetical protein